MRLRSKKGVWSLVMAGLGIGAFGIVLAVIALILDKFKEQMAVNSTSYNITVTATAALYTMATFLGVIAIGLMGFYLIRMLIDGLRGGGGQL